MTGVTIGRRSLGGALHVVIGGISYWIPEKLCAGVKVVPGTSGQDELSVPLWFAQQKRLV